MSDVNTLRARIEKLEAIVRELATRERIGTSAIGALVAPRVVYVGTGGTLTTESGFEYDASGNELLVQQIRTSEIATPSTPGSGFGRWFFSTSNIASSVGDDGVVRQMVRYADGTFTPTYFGASTAGVTTYAANGQVGAYRRVENCVEVALYVNWTNATGTGNALIGGLPFTARNTTNLFGVPSLLYNSVTYAAGNGIQQLIRFNTTQIEIYNAPASNTGVAAIAVETAGEFLMTATFFI